MMFSSRLRILLCACFALLAFVSSPATAQEESKSPNVLLVIFDDLNDYPSILGGHPAALTPNLERFAKQSVNFTHAYSSAVVCGPSRASLLTGISPHNSGIYLNEQPAETPFLNRRSLPQLMSVNGYHTLGRGKLVSHGDTRVMTRGMDDYTRLQTVRGDPKPQNPRWRSRFTGYPLDVPVDAMGDAQVANWAAEKLADGMGDDRPFFMTVGIYRPHNPLNVPREYFERTDPATVTPPGAPDNDSDLEDLPPAGRALTRTHQYEAIVNNDALGEATRAYLASVNFADDMFGRVLDGLEAGPYAENTIVIVVSDHGFHCGEKRRWAKIALWEQTTRVPMLIHAPGLSADGQTCEVPASLLDLYPTIADLAGVKAPPHLDGASLRPLLKDPAAESDRVALTFIGPDDVAVRSARYRYIRYADGGEELYDLENDPHELTNIAGDASLDEVKASLAKHIPAERKDFVELDQNAVDDD